MRWACRHLRAHGTKLAKQHRLAARMLPLPRHAADHAVPTFDVNSITYNSQTDHGDRAMARGTMYGHVKSVSARVQCGWSEGWPSRGVSATRKIMAKVLPAPSTKQLLGHTKLAKLSACGSVCIALALPIVALNMARRSVMEQPWL